MQRYASRPFWGSLRELRAEGETKKEAK